ncbi:hypothetical protein SHPE106448_20690 [Shewanella pealeana]
MNTPYAQLVEPKSHSRKGAFNSYKTLTLATQAMMSILNQKTPT